MTRGSSPLASRLSLLVVRAYQLFISPLKPPTCRYHPTCSTYAAEVLKDHPPIKAMKLIFRRLLSCHPWGGYGYDPPPKPLHEKEPREKEPR